MRFFRWATVLVAIALSAKAFGASEEAWQGFLGPEEFEAVGIRLAPKVDLFAAIWAVDPDAEIYGGASRDFYWFLRRKLAVCQDRPCIDRTIAALESRPVDVKEFIVGQSDVDVVTAKSLDSVAFDPGFLTRLQVVSPQWFARDSPLHAQEIAQGGVPVEKIRLARGRILPPADPALRDGVLDVYRAVPRLVTKDGIRDTAMWKAHENHELLGALRWVRQVAIAYSQRFGRGYPDDARLESLVDAPSRARAEAVFEALRREPIALAPFLDNELFRKRLRRLLQKIFRSYTNPTAAKRLFELLAIDDALVPYLGKWLEPYHTVMYAKHRDAETLRRAREAMGAGGAFVTLREHFRRNELALEKDRRGNDAAPFFHGTPDIDGYRSIVFQGILPSSGGSAGGGVYAVDRRSYAFARTWKAWLRRSGTPLVAKLLLDPDALVVDLTTPEGKAPWERWLSLHPEGKYETFADAIGVDLIKYSYEAHAYVIGNGAVVRDAVGDTVPLLALPDARAFVTEHQADPDRIRALFEVDATLTPHAAFVTGGVTDPARRLAVLDAAFPDLRTWARVVTMPAFEPWPETEAIARRAALFRRLEGPGLGRRAEKQGEAWSAFAERAASILGDAPVLERLAGVPDRTIAERIASKLVRRTVQRWRTLPTEPSERELESVEAAFPSVFLELAADTLSGGNFHGSVAATLSRYAAQFPSSLDRLSRGFDSGIDADWGAEAHRRILQHAIRLPDGPPGWVALLFDCRQHETYEWYARAALAATDEKAWTANHWRLLRRVPLHTSHLFDWQLGRIAALPLGLVPRPARQDPKLLPSLRTIVEAASWKRDRWPTLSAAFTALLPTDEGDARALVRELLQGPANWEKAELVSSADAYGWRLGFLLAHPFVATMARAELEDVLARPAKYPGLEWTRLVALSIAYDKAPPETRRALAHAISALEGAAYNTIWYNVRRNRTIAYNSSSSAKTFLEAAAYVPETLRKVRLVDLARDRMFGPYLPEALEMLCNFESLSVFPWRSWEELVDGFDAMLGRPTKSLEHYADYKQSGRMHYDVASSLRKRWRAWPSTFWQRVPRWLSRYEPGPDGSVVAEWVLGALLIPGEGAVTAAPAEVVTLVERLRPAWESARNGVEANRRLQPFPDGGGCGAELAASP